MNVLLRMWVVLLIAMCGLLWTFGLQPSMSGMWWPVAGLWAAAALAPYGLSVWVAGWLIVLGVVMDFMSEAPIGAWPLALLAAYGVALVAWDRQPPVPVPVVEAVAVIGGLLTAGLALGAASGVSGHAGFSRAGILGDFILTAALYPVVRFVLIPASIRTARR